MQEQQNQSSLNIKKISEVQQAYMGEKTLKISASKSKLSTLLAIQNHSLGKSANGISGQSS
jgi:hypothetical protein